MSTLQIEERISVSAPPARVWRFILDPARVAACLPGAKLDGTEGDKTFLGTMKVKVGPVLMEFKGKATMSEVVVEERRVTLTGTGNDKSGGGSARMDMKSQVLARDGGGAEIVVLADVDLAGKLVRFGRGMMEGISKQLFKQFSERVRAELESEEDEEEDEGAEDGQEEPAAATQVSADLPRAAEPPATEAPKTEAIEPSPAPEASKVPVPDTVVDTLDQNDGSAAPPPPETATSPASVDKPRSDAPAPEKPATAADDIPATVASPSPTEKSGAPDDRTPGDKVSAGKTAQNKSPEDESPADEPSPAEPSEEQPPKKQPASTDDRPVPKATALARKKRAASKKAALAPADNAPLDAGSLVWSAIWSWFRGLFVRLFGKKS